MNRADAACLEKLSTELEYPLDQEASNRLLGFSSRLIEWNLRINLTGARTVSEVLGEHIVDSFVMTRMVPAGSSVVDIGAGAGFPGLPFSILRPDCQVTLVEPRAKRVAFLRFATRELGLKNTTILRARCDDVANGHFDVACSRATFSPADWLPIGLDKVRSGGMVLVFANEPWTPENLCLHPANSIDYLATSGRRRWLGAFCST